MRLYLILPLLFFFGCSSSRLDLKKQEQQLNFCIDIQNLMELKDKGFYFDPDGELICQFYFPGDDAQASIIVRGKDLKYFYEGFRFNHNKTRRAAMDKCYFQFRSDLKTYAKATDKDLASLSYSMIRVCAKEVGYML